MRDDGESYEIWGTFSVMDHTRPGAFLAEVIMFDQLVIPVPPDPEFAATADEHDFAVSEWKRWEERQWDPERQRRLLRILEPIAVEVPWTKERQWLWQAAFEKSKQEANQQFSELLAGWKTGENLLDVLPAKAEGVVAVSPYRSLEDLERTLGITRLSSSVDRLKAGRGLPGNVVSTIVGREFTVPQDPDRDEFALLQEAVEVVSADNYRQARAAFHKSMLRFIRDGKTDLESIHTAVEDMNESLNTIEEITRQHRRWKRLERMYLFAQVLAELASAALVPLMAGKAALTLGEYTISEHLKDPSNPYSVRPHAALLHDAQRKLDLGFKAE